MGNIYLGINGQCLEKVSQNSAELSLLAHGNGTEIMIQKIKAGNLFSIDPGDLNETMEFFYILEGSIRCEDHENEVVLNKGDYFYVQHLTTPVIFKTLEEIQLLYVSTQPVFQFMSTKIKELYERVKIVELKDSYTHNHSKRVEDYSVKIAKKLQMSKGRMMDLGFAALFHDIGKVNVPDEILNKPSFLTDEEMEFIKRHPKDGAELLEGTFLQNVGEIVEQHHERLDGSGYPNGLTEDEISLEAKIIAVVDTYDAMTSDRPYRKGLSRDIALQELRRLCGIHYDKQVVEVFEQIVLEEE